MIIGGNTVRVDRPTLDSRLADKKAPDVLIFSNQKEFDKTIPLFKVKNRKVFISNNLELIKNYKLIMIEGVGELYKEFDTIFNWHLSLISGKIKRGKKFDARKDETIMYEYKIENDLVVFSKAKA